MRKFTLHNPISLNPAERDKQNNETCPPACPPKPWYRQRRTGFTFGFFLAGIFLGFLIILQIEAQKDYREIASSQKTQNSTSKIVFLTQEINLSKTKVEQLQKKHEDYQKALNDIKVSRKLIASDLENYQKFLGQKEIRGQGVEITIGKTLSLEEMIDFVNNLKNISIEALSLNDKRLICSSAFAKDGRDLKLNDQKINLPYQIKALGNPDVLKEALERKGGMIEQLKKISDIKIKVTKKNNLILPAYR
jgi:uncharacterized protein YlxW (UPF0749 family)